MLHSQRRQKDHSIDELARKHLQWLLLKVKRSMSIHMYEVAPPRRDHLCNAPISRSFCGYKLKEVHFNIIVINHIPRGYSRAKTKQFVESLAK